MVYIGSLDYDEQIKKAAGIIIFGCGSMLPYLLKKMEQLNLQEKIKAICDNNVSMQGAQISGIPVLAPNYVCKEYGDLDFLVYNQYFMEICEQLQQNHIARVHLIRQGSL